MSDSQQLRDTIHASCVAIDGHGVLLCGASGSGKSDLTLRLLDRGAGLVSDDYTMVERRGERLFASAPPTIAGKIEVRGLGIIDWPAVASAPVVLQIALDAPVERMPPEKLDCRDILGVAVPTMAIEALHASAPIKTELAVRAIVGAVHNSGRDD
jgi:Serine kinase of the HPr protein, regulates carbohydrate metabolism